MTLIQAPPNAPTASATGRFDVVVFKHRRLKSFVNHFDKLRRLRPDVDRVTIVSCSPSAAETQLVREFAQSHDVTLRYLVRSNYGLGEFARAQYFTGQLGGSADLANYRYVFHMQDHYLDCDSPASRWGAELGHRVKGDAVPDGIEFDLDEIAQLIEREELSGVFCDRNDPAWFTIGSRRFVAPSGGNCILRMSDVLAPAAQQACQDLMRTCDNKYRWAIYAEFMWGAIFFGEGRRFYDLKRKQLFSEWPQECFYDSPDDFDQIRAYYERAKTSWLWHARNRLRRGWNWLTWWLRHGMSACRAQSELSATTNRSSAINNAE